MDVHNPYRPPAAQQALFPPGDGRYVFVKGRPSRPLDPEDLETTRALYDGEVRWVDDTIGTTLRRLARQGELDNTMVVLTSDHGE
jgi:arylsulfatase A-like enzyme